MTIITVAMRGPVSSGFAAGSGCSRMEESLLDSTGKTTNILRFKKTLCYLVRFICITWEYYS